LVATHPSESDDYIPTPEDFDLLAKMTSKEVQDLYDEVMKFFNQPFQLPTPAN